MSDDLQHLSRQLYEALEIVGASESLRQIHQQSAVVKEIIKAIHFFHNFDKQWSIVVHYCGSSYEGSVTPDMESDIDVIFCPTDPPVVLDVNCIPHGVSCIMALDIWTYPGYVKLQRVEYGRRLTQNNTRSLPSGFRYDAVGRLCYEHYKGDNMHGPANMGINEKGEHLSDTVLAFKCDNIPAYANEWIQRERNHGWPTSEQLDTMSRMGCMVVCVGHWESPERDIEWRISFSLQERLLMSSLNPVQHKVYIVLKMIKKVILEKTIQGESLSSYHCKTCILYAVEETPADFWIPDNMINCILYCLRLLLQWTQDSYCPNYFIKQQNLFSKEGFMRIRDRLRTGLRQLIQMNHHFVYRLESDHISGIMSGGNMRLLGPVIDARKYEYMLKLKKSINDMFEFYPTIMHTSKDLSCTLGELQSSDGISGYTKHVTQEVVHFLEPWLHLLIAKSLVAEAIDTGDRHSANILLTRADEHLCCTSRTDVTSVRFAKASILYAYGKYEECGRLLIEIERDLTFQVLSHCPCNYSYIWKINIKQQRRDLTEMISQMPVTSIIKHHIASCVVFTRSESRITPTALQYEMYRSMDTEPGSRDEYKDKWFDFAVVDAQVYLYFLQYLVYEALHKDVHKTVALDNIKAEIEECNNYHTRTGETILEHKDTTYNLLGWIYLQQNSLAEAYTCFTESLKIRPDHNAAKFHLREMQL